MLLRREQLDLFTADHQGSLLDDVSPRYLAGPGDARHVTHALAAAGWTARSDPLTPAVDLVSPDRRYRLLLEPETAFRWSRTTWSLTSDADGEHWYASFGAVPAEILAGFTDGLLLPPPARELPEVWDLLADAGWAPVRHPNGDAEALSPDGTVHIGHRPVSEDIEGSRRVWRIEVRPHPDEGPPIWTAWIANSPPPHLMHGLATALTDPAPLQRNWQQPEGHYRAQRTESPVKPAAYVRAHHDRIASIRANVRATRRQARKALATSPPLSQNPASPIRQAR
ncbi:DUF317 domain-containing protein [Streptomyces sp. NPDC088789]|uniref:DUF317 domain-containing protein n=1 Tax=Streptomyces sp. NPDC088789 TaxID=3365899 RepID=UPI003829DA0F